MKIAIIGGGAAGFFAAINAKENHPKAQVAIFEKSKKLLSKVRISGGGRCNVTNACQDIDELCQAYPRGGRRLKKAFHIFGTKEARSWFESRGVPLIIQEDNCVVPKSQDSQSIIDCFLGEAEKLSIQIKTGIGVKTILQKNNVLELHFTDEKTLAQIFDKVIVATGGSPKRKGLEWLESLGHKIENPVPSLFTFNMPGEPITKLMGLVVEDALVKIQGTKLKATGPLLITHWGMSGPAILKLSAFGARALSERNYNFTVQVNWANATNTSLVSEQLQKLGKSYPKKILSNIRPSYLPERLWLHLLHKYGLPLQKRWGELGNKGLNKLTSILTNDLFEVKGKTTFKEEFVTCGGVNLNSIDLKTMQSKVCKNLYFAGEVLDIDAITGGYNFQAAWTTGFIAAKLN